MLPFAAHFRGLILAFHKTNSLSFFEDFRPQSPEYLAGVIIRVL